jgi:hypothetical protein
MFHFTVHRVADVEDDAYYAHRQARRKYCSIWVVPPGIGFIRGCRGNLRVERRTAFQPKWKGTSMTAGKIGVAVANRQRYDRHDRYRHDRNRHDRYRHGGYHR